MQHSVRMMSSSSLQSATQIALARQAPSRTRRRISARAALLCAPAFLLMQSGGKAYAQGIAVPPVYPNVDENGVDLTDGTFTFSLQEASIGSPESGISLQRYWNRGGWNNEWTGNLYRRTESGVQTIYIVFGPNTTKFTLSGGIYVPSKADGSTLTLSAPTFTYTDSSGKVFTFTDPAGLTPGYPCTKVSAERCYLLRKIVYPNGLEYSLLWQTALRCGDISCSTSKTTSRLTSVTSNTGYKVTYAYAFNGAWSGLTPPISWVQQVTATLENLAQTGSAVTVSYTSPVNDLNPGTITTPGGRTWTFTYSGVPTGIRRPGATSDNITVTYGTPGIVSSVTRDGSTWNYAYSTSGTTGTMVVTSPTSDTTTIVSDLTKGRPTSVTNGAGKVTSYGYDANGRLTMITNPEGDVIQYTYDTRGNITEAKHIAKSGSGLADVSVTATFDATCSNPKTCNKANSVTDGRGNTTDYQYDSTHGGITTVTLPPATTGAARPQTRYAYTPLYAWYKASGSTITQATTPVYVPTGVSNCVQGASCVGTVDEVKSTTTYEAGSSTVGSNLRPLTVTKGAGNGSLSAANTFAYDYVGNLTSLDGPLAGTDDTTYYRYNEARETVGIISSDPDGAGAKPRRATRRTYNLDGQVTAEDRGTVAGITDPDWAAFSSLEQITTTFDANARKTQERLSGSGTDYRVTQYTYDPAGRLSCAAIRMNPSEWSSLPASACTLGTPGANGPDRIQKTTYDAVGRVSKLQSGFGTVAQADESTTTYTDNGKIGTVTDAEGNKTTYGYDGHDRLWKTFYPSTTKGSGTSSTTDYEQLAYDANNNVTTRYLRGYPSDSTKVISYTYDNLNRLATKTLPGAEPDATYTYDLLGRLGNATDTAGHSIGYTYDALSRVTAQSSPLGTVSMGYDLAGRRTLLTWPDSFYVNYDYLVTGEVSAIRENGATSGLGVLATFGYDNLGRRTTLTRGNGTTTTYTFDNVSRLSSLALNLDGATTTNDVTTTFAYSPASTISSFTRNNDLYAWNAHLNVARGYTSNGLNQFTAAGGVTLGYDARGNLTSASPNSYGYSSENLMTTATVGGVSATLSYDPATRLYQTVRSGTTTRLQYDGATLIGEYNGSNVLQKRYVHGPNPDEPLVEYAGSGTGSGVRTFLHGDERGSIVARSNETGAKTAINSYDEFGIPGTNNVGRFQFTGQTWLADTGMYYYKARFYSPSLGRFMQTDPIGYGDGINWYNYVKADPVNSSDPSGLESEEGDGGITVTGRRPPLSTIDVHTLALVMQPRVFAWRGFRNYGPVNSGRSRIPLTCDDVPGFAAYQEAAMSAIAQNPPNDYTPAWLRGIFIHSDFSRLVMAIPGTSVNVSYSDGKVAGWLDFGSIRPDAVSGPVTKPNFVVELKTSDARLVNPQLQNYLDNLPPQTRICEIYEKGM